MNIRYKKIERVRLTGPMEEVGEAMNYCSRNGYSVKRSGPRKTGEGRWDVSRFAIDAEREATVMRRNVK